MIREAQMTPSIMIITSQREEGRYLLADLMEGYFDLLYGTYGSGSSKFNKASCYLESLGGLLCCAMWNIIAYSYHSTPINLTTLSACAIQLNFLLFFVYECLVGVVDGS